MCEAVSEANSFVFSIMDIRRFFLPGCKQEKGKDDSSEKKRPAEQGASARPPLPKRKF